MLTKYKWINYIVVIAVVGIVISAILQILTPSDPQIPATSIVSVNFDQTSSEFNNVVFTGSPPKIPDKMAVFQVKSQTNIEHDLVRKLVNKYSLEPHKTEIDLWVGQTHTLTLDSQYQQLSLAWMPEEPRDKSQPTIDLREALASSQNFITQVIPNQNLKYFSEDAVYLTGNYHLMRVEANQATLIEIPFSYELNSFPVYIEKQSDWPHTIIVADDGTVVKAVLHTKIYDFEEIFQVTSLEFENVLEYLNQHNLGSIINVAQEQFEPIPLDEISSGELSEVALEYRLDKNIQLAYPIFRFSGSFVSAAGEPFFAQILTPAVPVTLLK